MIINTNSIEVNKHIIHFFILSEQFIPIDYRIQKG